MVELFFAVCGGKFEDDNSFITSPWYPNAYEDNKLCLYDIEAPLGKSIVLNFTNFNIEADCDFDSLSIYDGVDSNGTKIGTYCGNENPPAAISTLNHMHLVFSTDSSNTGPGFKALYSFVDASTFDNYKCFKQFLFFIIFAQKINRFLIFRLWWSYYKGQRYDCTTRSDD